MSYDNRRIVFSHKKLREIISNATDVVNWYSHPWDRQVRGPFNRWFVLQDGDDQGNHVLKHSSSDIEFASAAMNNLEPLLNEIDKLQDRISEMEEFNEELNKRLSKSEVMLKELGEYRETILDENKELEKKLSVAREAINYALEWEGDSYAWNRLNKVLKELI